MTYRQQGVVTCGYIETTDVDTTAAALADITGNTFDLHLEVASRIRAQLSVQCNASAAAVGSWAIEINAVDGSEMFRSLATPTDNGSVSVNAISAVLPAGTYTVQGRHRRVSGAGTVSTTLAQLSAIVVDE
jgi:hypothetical protein